MSADSARRDDQVSSQAKKQWRDRLVSRGYQLLEAGSVATERLSRFLPATWAFLLGLWVNAVSTGEMDAFWQAYDITKHSLAWCAVLATAFVVIVPIARPLLRRSIGSSSQAIRLDRRISDLISPELREWSRGRIAWGDQIVLQSCPKFNEGWRTNEVRVVLDPTVYRFPSPDQAKSFDDWLHTTADDTVARGRKFRLMENPSSFTDDPVITLRVQENTYAQAAHLNRAVAVIPEQRARMVADTLSGIINYPHILCLQAVVATSDGYVLMTHRSQKVAYEPGSWSCSLEEQLSDKDLAAGADQIMDHWVRRAMAEELGLDAAEAEACDARILAVFLEADRLNTGVICLVTTSLSRAELDAVIARRPREDYEFTDWGFLHWDEIATELLNPSRHYHPTASLRLYMAGMVRYGVFGFRERIDREFRRTSRRWARRRS